MEHLKISPLITESDLQKKIGQLARNIEEGFSGEDIIALCVLKGSFIFFSDLIRSLNLNVRCEFIGLSSYGDSTKSSGQVRMTMDIGAALENKNVLIVEDIIDTGLTMQYLLNYINLRNAKSVKTAALLYKPEALKVDIPLDYVGFEIGNEFVVGYGLDYQGLYRNIPYVARVDNMN
tara:strand:- start:165 stop:695 length:531 start_codon:yes stop_codon:yes gene_type:complete